MNFVRKNLKWIITIIVVIIVTTGISVYATGQYLASQVTYNNTNVASALNELYDNKNTNIFVATLGGNTSNGLNWTSLTSDLYLSTESYNNNVANISNGIITMKKSGIIDIFSISKAHNSSQCSYARLYKNSDLIYSEDAKNEIIRKDTLEVNAGDTINFQIASGNTHGAGMITVVFK